MGFLVDASPLDWEDSLEVVKYVRQHGIEQFIRHYRRVEAIEGDILRWGDELEYGIFKIDEQGHSVRLSLRAPEIMKQLRQREEAAGDSAGQSCAWMPEFGSWMVEGTPGQPYSGYAADLLNVERNMRIRRARLLAALAADEICPTVTAFPLMGVGSCSHPPADPKPGLSESLFVPDEVINPAPRFGALVANIRRRRGSKVDIRMPRFADEKTPAFERHAGCPPPETRAEALQMEEVYMDAMAFGMGCCCLQVTFQTRNVAESRHLFDQLAVLAPVMLALTAATPIARGVLLNTDVRWDIIAQSVDDRTPAERGMDDGAARHPEMAGGGVKRLPKSRYDSISSFICDHLGGKDEQTRTERYNDVDAPVDEEALQTLLDAGVDAVLARHLAHLFTRDPLVVYRERIELDDATETDHFENIQSTNWQTVRWKPPPAKSDSHIGWRTEFRSMEVQLTDYENAAFTTFVVLVSRVILYFNLNLYTPISCVDENMRRAHARDAVRTQRFHFQQRSMPPAAGQSDDGEPEPGPPAGQGGDMDSKRDSRASASCGRTAGVEELSLYEVMVGRGGFKGLVPMVLTYLELIETDSATMSSLSGYLDFIVARASGRLHTPARWMRDFVCSHPDYRQDSVVSERIAADLLAKCHRIGLGVEAAPALLGDVVIPEVRAKDAYAAADMGDSHRLSRISRSTAELMASHQFRYQLQERRTRLQASEADLRKKWEKTRHELEEVEAQIAFLSPK